MAESAQGIELRFAMFGHKGMVTGLAWEPHGRVLASIALDGSLRFWDANSGQTVKDVEASDRGLIALAWAPEGEAVATGGEEQVIRIWSFPGAQPMGQLDGLERATTAMGWSPSGKNLVTTTHGRLLYIWDIRGHKLMNTLKGHTQFPKGVSFSVRGDFLATGSDGSRVRLWKGGAFNPDKVLEGHTAAINMSAWSSNELLATASDDHTVKIWDIKKGTCLQTLTDHANAVKAVAFSGDGRILASRSWDQTIRIWRCDTWETVAVLQEDTASPWPTLSFHPRKPLLASVGISDQVIRVWELNIDHLSIAEPNDTPVSFYDQELMLLKAQGVDGLGMPRAQLQPRMPAGDPAYITCPECSAPISERQVVNRQSYGFDHIVCPVCETIIQFEDETA